MGNIAATLLILRATELLTPGHGKNTAAQLALALYTTYNIAATVVSIPAGRHSDRRSPVQVLVAGTIAFGAGYLALALTTSLEAAAHPADSAATTRPGVGRAR